MILWRGNNNVASTDCNEYRRDGKQDYHISEPEWGPLIELRPALFFFIIMQGKREGSNGITKYFSLQSQYNPHLDIRIHKMNIFIK